MKASASRVCARPDCVGPAFGFSPATALLVCVLVLLPLPGALCAQDMEPAPAPEGEAAAEMAVCQAVFTAAQQGADTQLEHALLGGGSVTADRLLARTVQVCAWLENEQALPKAKALASLGLALLARSFRNAEASADTEYWKAHLLGTYLERRQEARALAREAGRRWPDQDRFVELELSMLKKQGSRRD